MTKHAVKQGVPGAISLHVAQNQDVELKASENTAMSEADRNKGAVTKRFENMFSY